MTLGQKFILLLETDQGFKKECSAILKKWNFGSLTEDQQFEIFGHKDSGYLPAEYEDAIKRLLDKNGLPNRFMWPLHDYFMTGDLPTVRTLPGPVRTMIHFSPVFRGIEEITLHLDLDANKNDVLKAFGKFKSVKGKLQAIRGVDAKSQPIRNFEESIKITKSKSSIPETAEDSVDWLTEKNIGKVVRKKRASLEMKRARHIKKLSGK